MAHPLRPSRLLRRLLLSFLGCSVVAGSIPAPALTLKELHEGASFVTEQGLVFDEFFVESTFYDPATIEVDILPDGFAYSVVLPFGAEPDPPIRKKAGSGPDSLTIYYSVTGLGPGERTTKAARKKKAPNDGYIGGIWTETDSETLVPFDEAGDFFINDEEEWVVYLGIEGTLADGMVDNSLYRNRAVRKKAGVPSPDASLVSELLVLGYGETIATQRFSTAADAIPEPAGAALFGVGALIVAAGLRRRGR